MPFRRMDISSVALAVQNPSALNLSWMAPISSDALIVSGVAQFLNDLTTVMKVRLTSDPENVGRHDESMLMRRNDETSLPPSQVWEKLRDSLAGFDEKQKPIPSPLLSRHRDVGIRQMQSMFVTNDQFGDRHGLLAARQSFIGIVNNILQRAPMRRDRLKGIASLYRSDSRVKDGLPIDRFLIWTQIDASYPVEPPPYNEWDIQVYSYDERNRALAKPEFFAAAQAGGPNLRILVNGLGHTVKHWSIWEFDAQAASTMLTSTLPYGIGSYGSGIYQYSPAQYWLIILNPCSAWRQHTNMPPRRKPSAMPCYPCRLATVFWSSMRLRTSGRFGGTCPAIPWRLPSVLLASCYGGSSGTGLMISSTPLIGTHQAIPQISLQPLPIPQ